MIILFTYLLSSAIFRQSRKEVFGSGGRSSSTARSHCTDVRSSRRRWCWSRDYGSGSRGSNHRGCGGGNVATSSAGCHRWGSHNHNSGARGRHHRGWHHRGRHHRGRHAWWGFRRKGNYCCPRSGWSAATGGAWGRQIRGIGTGAALLTRLVTNQGHQRGGRRIETDRILISHVNARHRRLNRPRRSCMVAALMWLPGASQCSSQIIQCSRLQYTR